MIWLVSEFCVFLFWRGFEVFLSKYSAEPCIVTKVHSIKICDRTGALYT